MSFFVILFVFDRRLISGFITGKLELGCTQTDRGDESKT